MIHPEEYSFQVLPSKIMEIAKLKEVERVFPRDTIPALTSNFARKLVKVNGAQIIDTTISNPDSNWLNNHCAYCGTYYGRGVWVGVYDSGIDTAGDSTTTSDFRELDSNGKSRVRRANFSTAWVGAGSHGTHVAGVIGGNGWNSSTSGGSRYLWRGVAPKVLFMTPGYSETGFLGHVNNHSHTSGDQGYYGGTDRSIDALIYDHSVTHTMVYAAANNGGRDKQYGQQIGYYSILANSKNAISVGATYKDTALRWNGAYGSSMGPTRDGRTKPDIVAPGASYSFPQKYPNRLKVDVDYIRFIRSGGATAKAYEFSSSSEGWEDWYGTANHYVDSGRLVFDSWRKLPL